MRWWWLNAGVAGGTSYLLWRLFGPGDAPGAQGPSALARQARKSLKRLVGKGRDAEPVVVYVAPPEVGVAEIVRRT